MACVQYPDLTEVNPYEMVKNDVYPRNPAVICTEFAFAIAAPGTSKESLEELNKIGFEHKTNMLNWYWSHVHDGVPKSPWDNNEKRVLGFWWLKNRKDGIAPHVASKRQGWMSDDNKIPCNISGTHKTYHLTQTGCGMKLGGLPLKRREFSKFFTLLRLPLNDISRMQMMWLKQNNFQHVDTGNLAQYWVNGWNPEIHTPIMEMNYWRERFKNVVPRKASKQAS